MRRHGNLFEKIVDPDNIMLAWDNAKKNKPRLRGVIKVSKDVPGYLEKIRKMLVEKTFTTGRYHEKIVMEPKKRIIYVLPFFPDRIVHHALMNVIKPIWTPMLIKDTYACIEKRGLHAGSRRTMEFVRRNDYCLKCDISKFFPSIDHEILMDMIRRKIKCRDTLWLFEDIVRSFPGGKNTPIGNYTSQWFSNMFLNELDQLVKQELKFKDYPRYNDDFLLFHNDKKVLAEAAKRIEKFLDERLKLKLSKCDIFPTSRGVDYLGYRHFRDYILLRKSTAKRVSRRLKAIPGQVESGKITLEVARSKIGSAEGWMKWANAHNFKQSLGFQALQEKINDRCKQQRQQQREREQRESIQATDF